VALLNPGSGCRPNGTRGGIESIGRARRLPRPVFFGHGRCTWPEHGRRRRPPVQLHIRSRGLFVETSTFL